MAEAAQTRNATDKVHVYRIQPSTAYPPEFKLLAQYVQDIQFGSVTLQIENGRIIQIDKNEKIRMDKKPYQALAC